MCLHFFPPLFGDFSVGVLLGRSSSHSQAAGEERKPGGRDNSGSAEGEEETGALRCLLVVKEEIFGRRRHHQQMPHRAQSRTEPTLVRKTMKSVNTERIATLETQGKAGTEAVMVYCVEDGKWCVTVEI